jgi:hypothetical protein
LILACPPFIEPISNKRPGSHIEMALIVALWRKRMLDRFDVAPNSPGYDT